MSEREEGQEYMKVGRSGMKIKGSKREIGRSGR